MGFLSNLLKGLNLYFIPAALICITVHECSHGYAAYRLGDPTAMQRGRISLNPIKHIDPVGLLLLIVAGFGWAKPVPVDTRYFKHPKRDMALTSLAGPVSNFILAFVMLFLHGILYRIAPLTPVTNVIYNLLMYTAFVSVGLGVFNLIPISPLDGSKILIAMLPDKYYYTILRYERYGFILLMLIVYLNVLSGPLSMAINAVIQAIWYVANLPLTLF